jgi:dTMP kinase
MKEHAKELRSPRSSFFVVIEGVDRVGKNTQADLLAERLCSTDVMVRTFTTPDYKTATGKLIAEFLKGDVGLFGPPDKRRLDDEAIVFQSLLTTNRYEVSSQIQTALALGEVVVCVRWWPSAVLYGAEEGLDPVEIRAVCSGLPEPDLYVLLDVDPDRVARRLDRYSRYEAMESVQRSLSVSYRNMWLERLNDEHLDPAERIRWAIVRDDDNPAAVAESVWHHVCMIRPELRVDI